MIKQRLTDFVKTFAVKIKSFCLNVLSDIKNKKLTKRVELFLGCSFAALLSVIICVCIIGCNGKSKNPAASASSENDGIYNNSGDESEYEVNELDKDYDKDAAVVDEEKYKDTVLQESEDAGEDYINETLFIGDSNTVRMMNYGYTSLENTLAVVGMGIQSVKTLKCVEFSGKAPVTMVEAVKLMQPRRIIITFGTNNANGMDTDTFIKRYNEALDAIHDAYPYADILINSVPPFAKKNSYPSLSISSIDKFNVALNEMANSRNLKFINSSSVMKDESTGYAKPEFMAGDGIHITKEGFDAMFNYIRTHSHITEDIRPKPLNAIPKQVKATYVVGGDGKMRDDKASYEQMSVDKNAPVLPSINTPQTSSSSETAHVHKFDGGKIIKEATYDEEGKREFKCESCGYTYTESIGKKERPKEEHKHTYQEVSRTNPQIGVDGKRTMKCTGCGNSYDETIPALKEPETPAKQPETETPSNPPAGNETNNPENGGGSETPTPPETPPTEPSETSEPSENTTTEPTTEETDMPAQTSSDDSANNDETFE